MKKKDAIKAVGYCRTSGESQRDNTSIPNQKREIEIFCERQGYHFLEHYVDESKSGAKIAGRDSFQRLMRDAATKKFDVVVVYQVDRLARDGVDILYSCKVLREDFHIYVIDTTNRFDSQRREDVFLQYIDAARAEDERLRILRRTIQGRIARASQGKPWGGKLPTGRKYDKDADKWYITEQGKNIKAVLEKYVAGKTLTEAAAEHGMVKDVAGRFSQWVKKSQLATKPYVVHFHSPDIGVDETVEIPAMPPVISKSLLKKVTDRFEHRRRWNREDVKKYHLSGYIYCEKCGFSMVGATNAGLLYFRHLRHDCPYMAVRGEKLTEAVLDFLYGFFRDQPRFDEAIKRALPSKDTRIKIERQLRAAIKRRKTAQKEIDNLASAVAVGADPSLLISQQDSLKAKLAAAIAEAERLEAQLSELPTEEIMRHSARILRFQLFQQCRCIDWRKLPYDEVKRFLAYIFGNNPKALGTGIFIRKEHGKILVSIKGRVDLTQELMPDGLKIDPSLPMRLDELGSKEMKRFQKTFAAERKTRLEMKQLSVMLEAGKVPASKVPATKKKIRAMDKRWRTLLEETKKPLRIRKNRSVIPNTNDE